MSKLSVSEAAEFLGVTKEAIYNRIRRKTLKSVVENGTKYVLMDDEKEPNQQQLIPNTKEVSGNFIEFLLKQIDELKEKNETLEQEIKKLIFEKEELLVQTKEEIKNIYKERDERLKQILLLIINPLIAKEKNKNLLIDVESEDLTPYEREIVFKSQKKKEKWQNVKDYMKEKGYSQKKKNYIFDELTKKANKNKFLKFENGNLFIKSGKKIKELIKK